MEDDRSKRRSIRGLWGLFYPIFLCAACLPQTLNAASLNLNGNCTVTDNNNPSNKTNCQDSNKHGGNRDTIIVDEGEVINVVASDSNETVIAIEGGHHRDTIINHGEIYLQVINTGEILSAWHNGNHNYSYFFQAEHKKTDPNQHTTKKPAYWLFNLDNISLDAIGIAGGYGNDSIENYGLLDVSVITTLTDEAGSAETYSIGITGDKGNDYLVNEGQLNVTSDAVVTVDDVTFSLLDSGDAQRQAMAIAKGITGDKGKDEITNKGQLTVTSNATVDTSDFNVTLIGGPVDVDASSEAWAGAIGLDGGEGRDHISNQGTMTVTANALADSENVSIDLIDISGGKSVRAPLSANAMAIGIVGGAGDDHIYNSGNLNVTADAKADALDVQITGLSLSAGGANTTSEAIAMGIHGGKGQDDIYNQGNITVKAKANTNVDNFNVTVFDLSFIPPLFGFDNEQVATNATSEATGIIAGDGNDKVTNAGSLLVQSDATVNIDRLAISLLGLDSEVNRTAMATVTGITGDHGNDYIKNSGQLDATSNAKLDLLSISVDLVGGATNIDASNQALASAFGIDGGDGHDHIFNLGSTNVTANASVNSDNVGISLISALQGQDIRAPIHVDADAGGILGGEGHDYIESTGSLTVTADARADALDMEFSAVDISSGGMSTTSEASAIGIDGGKGKSEIYNEGNITIKSTATTDTESFAFTLVDLSIVSDIVDMVLKTPVDSSTTATADGTGIKTGYDHDLISNHGSLSVTVDAITNTLEMSMSADGVSNFTELGDFSDFFLDEPMADISTKAEASVTGITSGHGHDEIYNTGTLFAKATADVTANSIGVDLPLPDLLPQILPNIDTTDVETSATASAVGITTGEGHDVVQNDGSVWSEAIANASSLSVNATLDVPIIPDIIDYNIPYSIEGNLVDVGAKSEAESTGIGTGKGHDYIYGIGDVTAKATTESIATNIAATVAYSDDKVSFGLSLANASTEGKASAFGITSGSGDDMLHTTGTILADAFVDTNSIGVTVDLQAQKDTIVGIGASVTKANSQAETNSVGVDLGEGNDDAHNEGLITAKAHNNVDAVAVDVAVTIPAGDEFGIIGEGNWVSTDTIATSTADGILGGDGRDHIVNSGTVTADAFSDPDSIGVTANASGTKKGASIGIALTQAKTEGTATSNGIRGGKDKDKLINIGTVDVDAKTDVDAVSVSASLTLTDKGVALTGTAADGSTNAISTASGMSGDEADDIVRNEGTVDVLADAHAESYSVSVAASGASKGVALGLALSKATSEAGANSEGISGGSHDDELSSSGLVKSHAKANVIAGTISVAGGGTGKGLVVEGAAADGSTTGNATATGITGDQGEDHIVNKGMVDVLADVDATSVTVGVTANGTGTGATIGIALGRATSKGEADSHGIRGGSDNDYIANSGTVKSHALTTTIAGSGALAAGGAGKGLTVEGAGVDAATNAGSTAEGISGDEGYVQIFNEGNVDVLADADATSISAAVSANGTGTGVTFGLGLARATSEADAVSTGLAGGHYGDDIYSFGLVKSHALSNVIAGSGALAAGGSGKGLTIEGAGADGSTKGTSTSVGINSKEGNDHIVNKGTVDVLADADATSISVSATAFGTGTGAAIGVAVGRARSEAEADSIGINGGEGNDDIFSSGMVKSHAKSNVIAGSGALSAGGSGTGLTATLAGADAATISTATAKGVNGGDGYDHIYSEDIVDVLADANATSVSVSVTGNFTGTGVSFGLGLARATSEADANSVGISGGAYHDEIFSSALVKSHAKTNVIAGSGGLAGGGTGTGLSVQGAGAAAGTNASSIASGITGDGGSDHIYSEGMVDVLADAKATSIAVSATANGTGTGVALGIGLARANSEASANSSGISGGAGSDEIASWDKVKSHATTQVIAGSATLAGGGAGTGLNIQGAAADGLSKGSSTATGITGDSGDDILQSEGELDVYAGVTTFSASVAVSANGAGTGVSAGVALARAVSEGEANSTGISGGDDNDHISNTQLLKAHAKSDVDAVSVSAAMGGTGTGVAIQGAAADAATVSNANATGISGNDDIDEIYNEGTLDVMADADANSATVGLSVSGTGAGVGLGVSIARGSTEAYSDATGISLGGADEVIEEDEEPHHDEEHKDDNSHEYVKAGKNDGYSGDEHNGDKSCNKGNNHHDNNSCHNGNESKGTEYLENHGKITVKSYADADSEAISAQLGISGAGLQVGGAIVDASTKANASAQGIEGSQHKDTIFNYDSIEAYSDAEAVTVSVGVSLNVELKGVAFGAAITDATAVGTAHSIGIAGLSGDDVISNHGDVTADSEASMYAVSVAFSAPIAFVPVGVSIADNTAIANADAFGIDGGEGHDYLENAGSILADAESDAFGISFSGTIAGLSLAYADVTADSMAIGMAGAGGDDVMHQTETATLTAKSSAEAIGTVITAALIGVTGTIFDENEITANSQSFGISSGEGNDETINFGTVNTDANSTATGVSVTAAIGGATFASMTTSANTNSTGIAGGEDDDHIMNQSSINAKGSSKTTGVGVSVALDGLSFADTSSSSTMYSTGIDSGKHDDYIKNAGSIHTEGNSTASGTSVSVALRVATFADTSTNATMYSTGISGDAGSDYVKNTGSIHSEGSATASGTTVGAALVGASFADTSTSATMYSTGISGGTGYDHIENLDSIIAEANSNATGTTVSVALTGAAFADLFSKSTSNAIGISTGADEDKVINKGTITVDADAIADGTSIAAGLVGYFDGDASTEVAANAMGIELGSGDDYVFSKGSIDITARSESSVTAGSGSLAGRASSKANITSSVFARGIGGGEGNDQIINKGSITVGSGSETDPWMSRLTSTSFTFNFAGVAIAESAMYSATRSTGLDGEAGDDRIHNAGDLNITATSYSSSTGTSIGIFGTADGGGTSGAISDAAGIAGGDGHDEIVNKALVDITSNSYARISGTSFTFGGTGEAGGGMTASTHSVGISGGNDMDMLFNEGAIDVDATSTLSSEGGSITPFGTSGSDFTTGAETIATGIDGGAGEGVIDNLANVGVTARSTVSQSGSSFTFGGTSEAGGMLAATTKATGIKGGNSHDEIWNEATIVTTANSTLNSTGGSVTPFGTSDTDPTSGAVTTAMGIDSGHGENFIMNHSLIDVNADSTVSISGSTFTFGGTGAASGKLTATTNAWGIVSGDDEDTILTEGAIDIDVSATLSSSNNADTAFGTADAGATSGADITAFGIDSGAGRDHIHSLSLIDITADASISLNASSYSFGGTSGTGGILAAQATAIGISGGADDDYIKSEEAILVDVTSSLDSRGGTNTTFGESSGDIQVGANSYATGIDAGSGHDLIKNKGTINIFSSASVESNNSSYVFGGYSETDAVVSTFTAATGIAAGSGDDHLYNMGDIIVDTSSTDTNDGSSYAEFGSAGTAGTVTAHSVSKGMDAGTGNDVVINKGKVDVKGLATSTSTHNTDTGFLFGDGDARARATTSVTAHGIDAGTGDNFVLNENEINVEIYNFASTTAKSDGADIFDGDAFSRADSTSSGVAIGVLAGNGNDTLINNGTITTTTSRIFRIPILDIDVELYSGTSSHADADGDGIDGDGTVRSYATTNVLSVGIDAGDGDNSVNNTGTISVNAKAIATATSKVDSDAGGSSSTRRTASVTANAFGIRTGAGRDHVINESDINVSTIASSNTSINHISASATGIATGAGDDLIENRGTITTSITRNGVTSAGTAIDSGTGNDVVSLMALAKVNGDIQLGSDNDTLNVFGGSLVTGRILGGSGNDTLVFIGEGDFSTAVTDFQHTIKQGDGTYTLAQLAPMEKISVEQGVLEIDGDYEFAAGSTYMPSVSNGDGQGKLVINGAVNFSAASINVMKGRGHHIDGEKQTVLYASEGILNSMSFNNIKLPEKTPLLEFYHEITADEVQVSTSVESFNTVATSHNQRIIADYMDGLLPNAEGNVSEALGEIQAMKTGGHSRAFSSVNPESYVNTQQALESGVKNYASTLLQRTRGLRNIKQYNAFVQPGFLASEQGEPLYKNQPANNLAEVLNLSRRAYRPYGAWVKTYRQDGELDQTAANTGFDFDGTGYAIGFDKWLDQKRVIGMSMGINETKLTADNNRTRSNIDSQLFSLYSSYVTDTGFIDSSISYGYNSYNTQRDVTIGAINNTVFSEHNGDVYGASIVGGLFFPVNTWDLETYGVLQYQQQDEDGFQESGAGGVSLSVARRKSDLLSSQLGLRFAKQFKKRNSSMFTEFGVAWIHDYDDDSSVEASFVDSPNSSFTVDAQDIDNDGALINLGLSYTSKKGFTGTAEYRTDIRDGYTDQTFFANIQYQFE